MAVLNFLDILTLKPNFFDDADIDSRLDKDELKMAILARCGTLLPFYTNSEMFKAFSDSFFKQRKNIISKLIDTTEFDYNPIDNYDRIEEVHRKLDSTVNGESGNKSTQENQVSAYDSSQYQPKDKLIGDVAITDKKTDDTTEDVTTRTHGNIGVTTTQQMIERERKVVLFNVYHWIAIEFEQNFFICVS